MGTLTIEGIQARPEAATKASDLEYCEVFMRKGSTVGLYFMRVKPISYLLNSSLVQDKLASGHILVVGLENGSLYFIGGTEPVKKVQSATLKVQV